MRSLSAKIFLFLFMFGVSLLAADLALRWYFQAPSDYLSRIIQVDRTKSPAKRLKPNLDRVLTGAYREFKFRITTDEHGFRCSVPTAFAKDSRILFLGDSQTVGVGVGDKETFPSYLGERLKAPVLNTACYGYSSIEEGELLAGPLAAFRPETVVLCFFAGNDPYENFRHQADRNDAHPELASSLDSEARFLGSVKRFLVRHSAIYHGLLRLRKYETFNNLFYIMGIVESNAPSELVIFKNDSSSTQESFWRITEEAIDGIFREVSTRKAHFLVLFIPDRYQIDPEYWKAWMQKYRLNPNDYDLEAPNKRLGSFCQTRGISFLDLTGDLREEERAGRSPYWVIDNHLNSQGNRRIADRLYSYFSERK